MDETQKYEIVEANIEWITCRWFDSESRLFSPVDHEAKWFVDELGSYWVKVRVNAGEAGIRTIVFRGDLVQEVAYIPRAPS